MSAKSESRLSRVIRALEPFWFGEEPLDGFSDLDSIEQYLGNPLPADYKGFLQWFSNGGEGKLPGGYLLLFPANDVLVRQREYGIASFLPSSLVFGLEGDDVFCFDTSKRRNTAEYPVQMLSLCSRDPGEVEIVGETFVDFLEKRLKLDRKPGESRIGEEGPCQ